MTISTNRIYLASRSPRRRELLQQIGIAFESLLLRESLRRSADVDEAHAAQQEGRAPKFRGR